MGAEKVAKFLTPSAREALSHKGSHLAAHAAYGVMIFLSLREGPILFISVGYNASSHSHGVETTKDDKRRQTTTDDDE